MLLSPRKNGLTSLFKEVRVFKVAEFIREFLALRVVKGWYRSCPVETIALQGPIAAIPFEMLR